MSEKKNYTYWKDWESIEVWKSVLPSLRYNRFLLSDLNRPLLHKDRETLWIVESLISFFNETFTKSFRVYLL